MKTAERARMGASGWLGLLCRAAALATALLAALPARAVDVTYTATGVAATPLDQGWTGIEISVSGLDSNADGLVDGAVNNGGIDLGDGGYAWQVRDDLPAVGADLPNYQRMLSESELLELYEHGWTLTAELKVARTSSAGYSGFWGWGFANGQGEWNTTAGAARVGFSPGVDDPNAALEDQRFKLLVYGGGEILLAKGSAGSYHTVTAVGRPRSTSYDLYIDGQHLGYFDAADSAVGGQTANQVNFGGRSSAQTQEVTNWRSIALQSGEPLQLTQRQQAIVEEYASHIDSIMGIGIDTSTGSFTRSIDLLSVSGLRDFALTANYDSQLGLRPGPLGYGWSHNYEARVSRIDEDHLELRWDANRSNIFTRDRSLDGEQEGSVYFSDQKALQNVRLLAQSDAFILYLRDGSNWSFAGNGELEVIYDGLGQTLEISRNSAGRVERIREPVTDLSIFIDYDKRGLISAVSDSSGRELSLTYDNDWRLTRMPVPIDRENLEEAQSISSQAVPAASTGQSLEVEVLADEWEGAIGSLRIEALYVEHAQPEDLKVEIVSPAGTRLDVTAYATPVPGALTMVDADLYGFTGEQSRGVWTLVLTALNGAPAGSFSNVSLSRFANDRAIVYEYEDTDFPSARIARAADSSDEPLFTNQYDALGRVVSQNDGRSDSPPVTVMYSEPDDNGEVTATFTSSMGFETRLTHDAQFRLRRVVNPLGHSITRTYDEAGNLIRRTDGRGAALEFEYDSLGRATLYRDELQRETRFEYLDETYKVAKVTDALGNVSSFEYYAGTAALGAASHNGEPVIDAVYHGNRQLRTLIFNDYSKTEYYLDDDGRTGVVGYPESKATARSNSPSGSNRVYDGAGRLVETTDYDGRANSTEYTGAGEVARTTDPDGYVEIYDHDLRGRVVRTTDKRGNISLYTYDGNGNPLTFTNARGEVTTSEYDFDDRLISVTDGRGGETHYEYDALGQIVKVTDPMGRVRRIEYDAAGNATAYYGDDGRLQVGLVYDARGQVIEARDGYGNVTETQYDALGRVVRVTEPSGAYRELTYDDRDRAVSSVDSTNRKIVATYDDRHGGLPDNVEIQHWNADASDPGGADTKGEGLTMNFTYNYANDMIATDDIQIQWEVDRSGLLSDIHNGSVVGVDFTYDSAGRMFRGVGQHQNSPYPDDERDRQYYYDEAGNLIEIRASKRLANDYRSASRRVYDELGRLVTYLDENDDVQIFTYDANGNLKTLTYPGGKSVVYEYDAANRLTKVTDWAGRVTTLEWNADDRITRIDLPNAVTRSMVYNKIGQLTRLEDRNASDEVLLSAVYQYDKNGKLVSEITTPTEASPAAASIDYSFDSEWRRMNDANGLILRDDPGNVTSAPGIGSVSYNARSRMVSTNAYKYIYDQEDNLFGWQSKDNASRKVEFTINPLGKLNKIIAKRESDGQTSSETLYVYGIGLLYEVVDGEARYFHPDARGSALALSDANGSVIGRVSYDPYGKIAARSGDTDTIFLYNGMYGCVTSPEELVSMRFRWYSPTLRQFLQRDPVIGDISNPASLNYFAYAGGDPISRIDPQGEFWWVAVGAVVGAVVNTVVTLVEDIADDGVLNTEAERYGAAALGGAVNGAIIAGTGGLGGAIVGGAAGSATENLVYAGLTGRPVDPGALAIETAIGGAAGAAGYGLGKAVAKVGGKVFAKHALSSNRAVSAVAKLFKPAKLARREAVGSLTELVVRSGKTSAAQIIGKIVASSAGSIIGSRIYDNLTAGGGAFSTGPAAVGGDGGGYGFFATRRALGATDVWIRNIRGGQADKDNGRGIFRNYGLYLEMIALVGQDTANAPTYSLLSF